MQFPNTKIRENAAKNKEKEAAAQTTDVLEECYHTD